MTTDASQESEREAVEAQTQLLAFDRQNHMGASDVVARTLKKAIQEEAEAMLSNKKVVNGAVNIAGNTEKMKASIASVTISPWLLCTLYDACLTGVQSVLTSVTLLQTGDESILATIKDTRGQYFGGQAGHEHLLPSQWQEAASEGSDTCEFHARARGRGWVCHGPCHKGHLFKRQSAGGSEGNR